MFGMGTGVASSLFPPPNFYFLAIGYWLWAIGYNFSPIAYGLLPIAFIYKEG